MSFAFLFPGQSAQSVGLLGELAGKYEIIEKTFNEASEVLGKDLWKLSSKGPEAELNKTIHAQPVLLTASIALWRLWTDASDKIPSIMAGHSLGEYSALTCAGVINFGDALRLVQKRAELMQASVPAGQGTMVAVIGLNAKKLAKLCREVKNVEIANLNSPQQTVVSGNTDAVEKLVKLGKEHGAKRCIPLKVSVPSHCFLMKGIAKPFGEYLEQMKFGKPKIPTVQNIDATVKTDTMQIKEALVKQLYSPIQWLKTVQYIDQNGADCFIEAGPSRVLNGLLRSIDSTFTAFSIKDIESFDRAIEAADGWSV